MMKTFRLPDVSVTEEISSATAAAMTEAAADRAFSKVRVPSDWPIEMTGIARRMVTFGAAWLVLAATSKRAFAADSKPVRGPGVNLWRSGLGFVATVDKLQQNVKAKGIRLFDVIDQAKLAAEAGISLRPSTLLIFGNPPLGIQFLSANPLAGLDWPVRMLVVEDEHGAVLIACTDFAWIARHHGIADRDAAFLMATKVVASIVASVGASPA